MLYNLQSGIYFLITSFTCLPLVFSYCDVGKMECVYLFGYDIRGQWAMCVTDQYLRASARGACVVNQVVCYNQCMMDLHQKDRGPVSDDCACKLTDTPPNMGTVPPWCNSPNGTECSWYRQCLEARYPCNQTGNSSYALDFGEKFCKLYDDHYKSFDREGQKWIDAVRKCLQLKLVPLLSPFKHPTCEEIKDQAFKTHTECYLRPPDGESVCNIGVENMFHIIATVYPALSQEFRRTAGQSLNILGQCIKIWTHPSPNNMLTVSVDVRNFKGSGVDASDQTVESLNNFINHATGEINHREEFYGYVFPMDPAFPSLLIKKRSINTASNMTFGILLLPRFKYDLNYNGSTDESSVNATNAIRNIVENLESGLIGIDLPEGVMLQDVTECDTVQCNNQTRAIVIPTSTTTTSTPIPTTESLESTSTYQTIRDYKNGLVQKVTAHGSKSNYTNHDFSNQTNVTKYQITAEVSETSSTNPTMRVTESISIDSPTTNHDFSNQTNVTQYHITAEVSETTSTYPTIRVTENISTDSPTTNYEFNNQTNVTQYHITAEGSGTGHGHVKVAIIAVASVCGAFLIIIVVIYCRRKRKRFSGVI